MNWALTLGRSALAVALGVLIGAGAALVGIHIATRDRVLPIGVDDLEAPPSVEMTRLAPPTVVDVSHAAVERSGGPLQLVAMLGASPTDPAVVDLTTQWERAEPGDYIDVELGNGRRALVLVHP
jgi:hypothetical protein